MIETPKLNTNLSETIIYACHIFYIFVVYLTMLSVSPDNTVSNNWIIMKGQGYGRQWSWPNLHDRKKPKKYQSYVPDQIQNRLLQNTSEHYFFSQLALRQNVCKWKLPDNLHAVSEYVYCSSLVSNLKENERVM
jgi:hypothetical protein